jgi:gliding motility-associated-like protein
MLQVSDTNGCISTANEVNMITINDNPIVNFSATNNQNCYAPLTTNFTPQITIYNNLPYHVVWNFGDGGTGTQENTSHTYTNFGHYNVSLTVTDDAGCSTTVVKNDFVIIDNITAAYTGNDTVCKNAVTMFTNATSFPCQWQYNGQTSTNNSIFVSYSSAGTHYITLITDPNGPCRSELTFPVFVEDVTASFTMQPNDTIFCTMTPITFTSTSLPNAVTFNYTWIEPIFGNTMSALVPSHTTYLQPGTYQVTLTVGTSHNCQSTVVGQQFTILNRSIDFNVVSDFCVPTTAEFFYDLSNFTQADIASASWQIDAQIISPGVNGYVHSFPVPGDFDVTLTITDNYGCQYTHHKNVPFGTHYVPEILDIQEPAPGPLCSCNGWTILIDDNHDNCGYNCSPAFVNQNATQEYNTTTHFPDGVTYTNPYFYTNIGMNIREFVYTHNGCNTQVIVDTVFIYAPLLVGLSATNTCENTRTFTFNATSYGTDHFYWEFYSIINNNTTLIFQDTTITNIYTYTFPSYGKYKVYLSVDNDTTPCVCTTSLEVIVDGPLAMIIRSADTICKNNMLYLEAVGASETGILSAWWDFGNGQTSTDFFDTITYTNEGIYTITLAILDMNNCPDTTTIRIVVPTVNVAITADAPQGCVGMTVNLYDATITNDPIPEESYTWVLSNGEYTNGSDTITQTFNTAGNYSVALHVVTRHGCHASQTYNNYITVSNVNSTFLITPNIACVGDTLIFRSNETSLGTTYNWDFGNGSSALVSSYNCPYQYHAGGYYDVTLAVRNALGCEQTVSLANAVRIEEIQSNYLPSQTNFACFPALFEVTTTVDFMPDTMPISYFWNFGTSENSDLMNPIYVFNFPGIFNVSFITTTPAGCADTTTHLISINGPIATLTVSDTIVCFGDAIQFQITNLQDVSDFLCVLGDGTAFTQSSFSHTYSYYPTNGDFTVNLRLFSYAGIDTCIVNIPKIIHLENPIADFHIFDTQNNEINAGCSPLTVVMSSSSQEDFSRVWSVDNHNTGNALTEQYLFNNATQSIENHTIMLVIKSEHNCLDTLIKSIIIYPKPVVMTGKDVVICPDDSVMLSATGALSYHWLPNINISDPTISNPTVYPTESTEYQVIGVNQHNCLDTNSVIVFIQENVYTEIGATNITINIGECYPLSVVSDQANALYWWTPDYNISCLDCATLEVCPMIDTTYFLTVSDSLQCFTNDYFINFIVRRIFTLDVPDIFTPLSGDDNSIVYVRGYGIEKLLHFRIFNRWGELIFETNDINVGWDGKFKNVMQNIDNYAYTAEAKMFNGEIIFKKGILMLVK